MLFVGVYESLSFEWFQSFLPYWRHPVIETILWAKGKFRACVGPPYNSSTSKGRSLASWSQKLEHSWNLCSKSPVRFIIPKRWAILASCHRLSFLHVQHHQLKGLYRIWAILNWASWDCPKVRLARRSMRSTQSLALIVLERAGNPLLLGQIFTKLLFDQSSKCSKKITISSSKSMISACYSLWH